jgi:hypothetical protein
LEFDYFTDYHEAGVAARVAIQLVKKARRDPIVCARRPADQVYTAIQLLDGSGFPMVRMALHSLAVHIDLGVGSAQWLSDVCYRDLMGHSFRRCFFNAYKEGRRLTPRVTNRGGQLPSSGSDSAGKRYG